MTKNENTLGLFLFIPFCFALTLFVTLPIVKSIWHMLVYPICHYDAQSGVILFILLANSILRLNYKKDSKETLEDSIGNVFNFYFALVITWGFAALYTYFI